MSEILKAAVALSMREAKKLGLKAAGEQFFCTKSPYYAGGQEDVPNGVIGTILPELSNRGKLQAELTCTEPGCTATHIREVSDWHQCTKCEQHSKSKGKSKGSGMLGVGGQRSVKLPDGTILREMQCPEGADEEMKALVAENNALFGQLKAEEDARRAKEQEAHKAELAAKLEADKAERAKKLAAEQKAKLLANLELIKKVAAEKGVPVSPKTEADVAEASEQ